jgi:fumarylacetoacetate (FAA) hydrolase family protein
LDRLGRVFRSRPIEKLSIDLSIEGIDGFLMQGQSDFVEISRDVEDMVSQVIGAHHQYPDGLMLFTGTMFAPTQDRAAAGGGFTHKQEDLVRIHSPQLGTLMNRVGYSDRIEPWSFGCAHLMRNLAARGYLERCVIR